MSHPTTTEILPGLPGGPPYVSLAAREAVRDRITESIAAFTPSIYVSDQTLAWMRGHRLIPPGESAERITMPALNAMWRAYAKARERQLVTDAE